MKGKCDCQTCNNTGKEDLELQKFVARNNTWYLCEDCIVQIEKFCLRFLDVPNKHPEPIQIQVPYQTPIGNTQPARPTNPAPVLPYWSPSWVGTPADPTGTNQPTWIYWPPQITTDRVDPRIAFEPNGWTIATDTNITETGIMPTTSNPNMVIDEAQDFNDGDLVDALIEVSNAIVRDREERIRQQPDAEPQGNSSNSSPINGNGGSRSLLMETSRTYRDPTTNPYDTNVRTTIGQARNRESRDPPR